MGRKSLPKPRVDDRARKRAWAEALFAHFQEQGLRGLTMDEAAALLGVSKATLYRYFRSREEILASALAWKLDALRRFRERLDDPGVPYLERFAEGIRVAAAELSTISTRFLADLRDAHPALWEQVQAFLAEAVDALRAFYAEGVAAGHLARAHPGVMAAADEAFFQRLSDPAFLEREGLALHEAVAHYFVIKVHGLFRDERVPEGRRLALLRKLLNGLPGEGNFPAAPAVP
jgi:AcrR family transcriptional regulator